ncbi:MAG TPA: glycosyltransferase family 87 protein, partial [Candidatus Udaeobacter sp.]|nr:glycosyltransferase family 87 protein [Candidatus Udaeobacter sp.]
MRQAAGTRSEDFADHLINVAPAIPALALALIAITLHYTADFGLAYRGGVEAWATGHPQRIVTWTATPFLALVMALVSRLGPEFVEARIFMALDIALWMVALFVVWTRLRPHVSPTWWWATLAAAALFAPAVSTIFWLQFNLVILVLALYGFVLIGRREGWAAFLIGLAIALKPIVILLPVALLLHKRTRRVGAWSIAVTASLTVAGLGFLAWRAADLSVLNPFDYLQGFLAKGQGAIAACIVENYSPVAMLCRLGVPPTTVTTVVVAAIVLVTGYLLVRHLPDTSEGNWELFAAACFLSIMLGPI